MSKKCNTICSYCHTSYGILLNPYISFLDANMPVWKAIILCKCEKDSLGVQLNLIEDNRSLKYKKVQIITTDESQKREIIVVEDDKQQCEVCYKHVEILKEVGNYWVCDDKECKHGATCWTELDIDQAKKEQQV